MKGTLVINTWFPKNISAARLERDAEKHAFELDFERSHIGASDGVPADRLVVNYLRHQCTDYDDDQSGERHREACEAIALAFPWLAEECQQQIKRRVQADREAEEMAAAYEREQREQQLKRKEIADKSKAAIKTMTVGQKVQYAHNIRCVYEAEITKVGRSKVTVAYEVKTGKDRLRTATVHAALVTPIT
ncbi:hypothetical protein [Streptomyces sp. cg36]|uniref:hypothetical protein n=1 Tax=Streptomyces sp. cg36 TaxID=3238798 RepID=UPI0034E2167B